MQYYSLNSSIQALLIEGSAGCGKSTYLIRQAQKNMLEGQVLMLTYSRAGREVLEHYAQAMGMQTGQGFKIVTLDALALEWLQHLGDEAFVLKRDVVVRELLPDLIAQVCEEGFSQEFLAPDCDDTSLQAVMQDLDLFRATRAYQAWDDNECQDLCGDQLNYDWFFIRRLFNLYEQVRASWQPPEDDLESLAQALEYGSAERDQVHGRYGFRTMGESTYDLLQQLDTAVDGLPPYWKFAAIFIDEFHDTTPLQLEFIEMLVQQLQQRHSIALHLMAVGDRQQNIFAWRGSNTEYVFERFCTHFQAQRQGLRTSYRFGESLAKLASQVSQQPIQSSNQSPPTKIQIVTGGLAFFIENTTENQRKRWVLIAKDGADLVEAAFDYARAMLCCNQLKEKISYGLTSTFSVRMVDYLFKLRYPNYDLGVKQGMPLSLSHTVRQALLPWMTMRGDTDLFKALSNFAEQAELWYPSARDSTILGKSMLASWKGLMACLQDKPIELQQWPAFRQRLQQMERGKSGIGFYTVSQAKGREFDAVLVYKAVEEGFTAQGHNPAIVRNQFYVAITRAKKTLLLCS